MKINPLPHACRRNHPALSILCTFIFSALWVNSSSAAVIWNGANITFAKPNFANGALAVNQDHLTANVWIARGPSQGLYNARTESSFGHFFSPQGTEWADGSLANYATLSYHDWNSWAKGVHSGPPSIIGVNAVVHLLADDIYLSVRFTSWGGSSGGFSYIRSTPIPEPSTGVFLLAGLGALALAHRRRGQSSRRPAIGNQPVPEN